MNIKTIAKIAWQVYGTCVIKGILDSQDTRGQQLREQNAAAASQLATIRKEAASINTRLQQEEELSEEELNELLAQLQQLSDEAKSATAPAVRAAAADALHQAGVWAIAIKGGEILFG